MDYNEFEWIVVEPKSTFVNASIKQLIGTVPLTALLIGISFYFTKALSPLPFLPIFIVLSLIDLLIIFTVNAFFIHLQHQLPPHIVACKLDETGITVANKKTALSSFNIASIKPSLEKLILPYSQWQKTSTTIEKKKVTLSSSQGNLNLYFSHEYDRQKFIKLFLAHFN